MPWSPVSSALIFVRGALLHFGFFFFDDRCSAWKHCSQKIQREWTENMSAWERPDFFPPQKEQKCWRNWDASFVIYRGSHSAPASNSHPSLSLSPQLSVCQVVSHTNSHTEEGKKGKQQQWFTANQPIFPSSLESLMEETDVISVFRQECRCEGEEQVTANVQMMGRKSWRRKGFAPCVQSK